jgi:hypothetical protein
MMDEIAMTTLTLYDVLAEVAAPNTGPDPDTVETKQIETVDNDFATTLLGGIGL